MIRVIEFLISLLVVVVVFVVIALFLPSRRSYSYSVETNRPKSGSPAKKARRLE